MRTRGILGIDRGFGLGGFGFDRGWILGLIGVVFVESSAWFVVSSAGFRGLGSSEIPPGSVVKDVTLGGLHLR